MTAVRSLCSRGILLKDGEKVMDGKIGECIDGYLSEISLGASNVVDVSQARRHGMVDKTLEIQSISLEGVGGRPLVRASGPLTLDLDFVVREPLEEVAIGLSVMSAEGVNIFECRSSHDYGALERLSPGEYRITCSVGQNILSPGVYFLSVGARCSTKRLDYVRHAMTFEVYSDETVTSLWLDDVRGCVRVPSVWTRPQPIRDYAETI
jgi:lipopolysaccharide transport system ATP-binding protein